MRLISFIFEAVLTGDKFDMTSKRIFLFVILSTYWISCFSSEKKLQETSLIKKSQDSLDQQKKIPKSLHAIRRNLKRLLLALIQLQSKVEKQCPRKLKEVEATIERVKTLLENVKSKDSFARVKEKDLDLVRLEVQNFILSVRQEIADQAEREKENLSQDVDLFPTIKGLQKTATSLEMKEGKRNVLVEKEFEIIKKKVLSLKKGWKNLLKKIENIKNFLAKYVEQEPSAEIIALHEKLCCDINGIYLKAHESIYHVSLIEDELNSFLSDEEETLSYPSLRSLRSDTIIEEEEFEKIQRRFDQFLSSQNIIPHYVFSDEENESSQPEIIQQEDIDLLRKELKVFYQQFQQFRIQLHSLQALDSSLPMLKPLEEELSTAEQELKCFRSCLEIGLDAFLNTGKIDLCQQKNLSQKKETLSQKLTQLKQAFDLVEEQSLEPEKGQIQGMHLIEEGETLCSIAEKYGVSIEKILQINPDHKEPFKEGDLIKIPVQQETSLLIKEQT